jgi:hypothetical protein
MGVPTLTKGSVKVIEDAVDELFDRIKARVLGPDFFKYAGDKKVYVGFKGGHTIPGIYRLAATMEDVTPNERVLNGLVKVAEGYLDAERERVKAQVLGAVNSWLINKPKADPMRVLSGELAPIWAQTLDKVSQIVDTESTKARNMGTLEGVSEIAAARGIEDPSVFFIVVRDDSLCDECKRLHLMPDGKTPKVYKLSEVSGGYHKRGDNTPSVNGLHPRCRCSLVNLAPGYGFDDGGGITFIDIDHDEFAVQRGSSKE